MLSALAFQKFDYCSELLYSLAIDAPIRLQNDTESLTPV